MEKLPISTIIDKEFDKYVQKMLAHLDRDLTKLGYSNGAKRNAILEIEQRYYNLEPKKRIERIIKDRYLRKD